MKNKTLYLSFSLFFLVACTSYPGYYTIKAFDSNENRLDGVNLIYPGSSIHSGINGMCSAFPGATLVINNTSTKDELLEESPYQCKGEKAKIIAHSFMPPEQIINSGIVFKLAHRSIRVDGGIYEYTTNNEEINEWNQLITLIYKKGAVGNTPLEFIKERDEGLEGGVESEVVGLNGYTNIIFKPGDEYSYYESSVSKSFHIEKCKGRVSYTYAEKYSEDIDLEKIENDIRSAQAQLKNDSWMPNCMAINK